MNLVDVFTRLDTDGSNSLQPPVSTAVVLRSHADLWLTTTCWQELKKALKGPHTHLLDPEIEDIFEYVDSNKDGNFFSLT